MNFKYEDYEKSIAAEKAKAEYEKRIQMNCSRHDIMTTDEMLKELNRIWPKGKNSVIYTILEKQDYYRNDIDLFERLFKEAVSNYDNRANQFPFYKDEMNCYYNIRQFLEDIAQAIIKCFKNNVCELYDNIFEQFIISETCYGPLHILVQKLEFDFLFPEGIY